MIDAVSARHNDTHQTEASQAHSANWLRRAVYRVQDSTSCYMITKALSGHRTRQVLTVSAFSLSGAAIGLIRAPDDDASIILGFYAGYMAGLLCCTCYNVYQSIGKPWLEASSQSSHCGKYRV